MSVDEARKAKHACEIDIIARIQKFERESGMSVMHVDLVRGHRTMLSDVGCMIATLDARLDP